MAKRKKPTPIENLAAALAAYERAQHEQAEAADALRKREAVADGVDPDEVLPTTLVLLAREAGRRADHQFAASRVFATAAHLVKTARAVVRGAKS